MSLIFVLVPVGLNVMLHATSDDVLFNGWFVGVTVSHVCHELEFF